LLEEKTVRVELGESQLRRKGGVCFKRLKGLKNVHWREKPLYKQKTI
jgi:hypothetical protein